MLLAVKVRVGRPPLVPVPFDVLTDPLAPTVTSCPASRFPAPEKVPMVETEGIVKLPESTEYVTPVVGTVTLAKTPKEGVLGVVDAPAAFCRIRFMVVLLPDVLRLTMVPW